MREDKMLFDTKGERSSRGNHKNIDQASNKIKLSHHRRIISKEDANNNISVIASTTTTDENSNWPHFADDDYIIFCFREDGAFEVVKNNGSKTDNHDQLPSSYLDHHNSSRNFRPVNRKLNYGDNTKTVMVEKCNKDHKNLTGKLAHEVYPTNYGQKMAEEKFYLDSKSVYGGNFEEHRIVISGESSDHSAHSSNASSGSFAFPALGWEWTGSPERMPKTEGLTLRKHKARFVVFQCCRF
ncbi:protein BREAKING OF ASYMMETRY IN THE STOMATAL LINEAGE-like isoform X1 [Humulus lupulus]|uniref:protein BREAKING OF ASYMMETRY IN THE STOMATAL LINEAGE-like isoform X1 n=1 Tax=Humulus lupulus TaxID=3486 RepID=UPI002B4078A1|nr:protein BREAKING OF ASYMMETRY IN THE STOMATAL LINEAGE-like isoform X1 [Humulus lupulus]